MKTQEQLDMERTMLLHTPHNIMITDRVIDLKVEAFTSTITLGYNNPAGQNQVAVTLQMPTSFVKSLSEQLSEKLRENVESIKSEHKKFIDSI